MTDKTKILVVGNPSDYQKRLIDKIKNDLGEQVEIVYKTMQDNDAPLVAGLHTVTVDSMTVLGIDECTPKPNNYDPAHRRSKGEKKRQRSEWNSNMKGYRK